MEYYKTTEKVSVNNYPYGYLKTTAYFGLEHKSGKGFRTVSQTINPKNGRLNAEKKSTYCPILVMYKDDDGHIKYDSYSFYHDEAKRRAINFLAKHFDLFTPSEIKDIAGYCKLMLKADIWADTMYSGSDFHKLLPLYEEAIKTCVKILKTGENLFSQIVLDFDAINACKTPDFNPFSVANLNKNNN